MTTTIKQIAYAVALMCMFPFAVALVIMVTTFNMGTFFLLLLVGLYCIPVAAFALMIALMTSMFFEKHVEPKSFSERSAEYVVLLLLFAIVVFALKFILGA